MGILSSSRNCVGGFLGAVICSTPSDDSDDVTASASTDLGKTKLFFHCWRTTNPYGNDTKKAGRSMNFKLIIKLECF